MARIIGYLVPVSHEPGRSLRPKRALAVVTITALLMATVAPCWAAAAESDSEGEGGSASPGLVDPHFDPGVEETALESIPGVVPEADETEEAGEELPIETEPAQESELTEPVPSPEEVLPPAAPEPEILPPPTETPAPPPPPEYTPAAPEYVAPSPPSVPIENDPIVAPPGASEVPPKAEASPSQPQSEATAPDAVSKAPLAVVPSSEPEAPLEEAPPPTPAPTAVPGSGGLSPPLRGRSAYTVRPGDCLWMIAEALLPGEAGNEEIAAEVARLWHLNRDRIGTGDPNVILTGTQLALV